MKKTGKLAPLLFLASLVVLLCAALLLYNSLSDSPENNGGSGNTPPKDSITENNAPPSAGADAENNQPYNSQNNITFYTADGTAVSLSDFRGKPVVLNFWASWCGPCRMEMPHFEAAFQKYGNDVEFVLINLGTASGDTRERAENFIASQNYTFPVYYDSQDGHAAAKYSIYSIPCTYFISSNGDIVSQRLGSLTRANLENAISALK